MIEIVGVDSFLKLRLVLNILKTHGKAKFIDFDGDSDSKEDEQEDKTKPLSKKGVKSHLFLKKPPKKSKKPPQKKILNTPSLTLKKGGGSQVPEKTFSKLEGYVKNLDPSLFHKILLKTYILNCCVYQAINLYLYTRMLYFIELSKRK